MLTEQKTSSICLEYHQRSIYSRHATLNRSKSSKRMHPNKMHVTVLGAHEQRHVDIRKSCWKLCPCWNHTQDINIFTWKKNRSHTEILYSQPINRASAERGRAATEISAEIRRNSMLQEPRTQSRSLSPSNYIWSPLQVRRVPFWEHRRCPQEDGLESSAIYQTKRMGPKRKQLKKVESNSRFATL